MPRIVKNTLLNYIPTLFEVENIVNPERIFSMNNKPVKSGNIVYLCEREVRVKDNFALQFAIQKSKELNMRLKIIHPKTAYEYLPKQKFLDEQIKQAQKVFQKLGFDFEVLEKSPFDIISSTKPALLVVASVKAKSLKGESDWLKNNVASVILLSVAALSLVGIILLLVIKPKNSGDVEAEFERVQSKNKKK